MIRIVCIFCDFRLLTLLIAFVGLFCASFYHFFVNDSTGPVGNFLRSNIPAGKVYGLTDVEVASCVVTYFMQIVGILQLPAFLGPNWSPFGLVFVSPSKGASTLAVAKSETENSRQNMPKDETLTTNNGTSAPSKQKKKKNKNKLKTT